MRDEEFNLYVCVHVYANVSMCTEQATFTNSTEVLFAVLTFYQLRVVERLWGSRKFAVSGSHHPSFNMLSKNQQQDN